MKALSSTQSAITTTILLLICAILVTASIYPKAVHSDESFMIEQVIAPYYGHVVLEGIYGKSVVIRIDGYLTSGTDAGCYDFSEMIWEIMCLDDRFVIYVEGDWIPSTQNPITYRWAYYLRWVDNQTGAGFYKHHQEGG